MKETRHDCYLWEQIKKGDMLAFNCLYDKYVDCFFSYGIQFCRDREYTKDCIHDLFLDIYKYRKNLSEAANVKSYLQVSLKRKITKRYKQKVVVFNSEIMDAKKEGAVVSHEEHLIRLEFEKENKTKFSRALQKLPLQQKEGLLLKFYQNKSYEEISEILGITVSSCRTLVYRALKNVRQGVYNIFL